MNRIRPVASSLLSLLLLLVIAAPAGALIMVGRGNTPVNDAGWPLGALAVANLKTRVGWWEGPPFGGGQSCFLYRGDTVALEEAIKAFAAIRSPSPLQLVLHEGPQNSQFLSDPKDPKSDTHYDWSFTVWNPHSWHQLFNDPRTTFMADSANFRKPVDPPRLDVYLTDRIDWKKITVPEGVQLIDERKIAGAKPASGAVIRGDVFDMATGKPINGATVQVERQQPKKPDAWETVVSATSDAIGRFDLEKIPAGNYRLTVSATKYAPRMIGYEEIKDGTAQKRSIELSAAARLTGTVTDPADGSPVAGVTVTASNTMGIDSRGYSAPNRIEVKSDDKGQFTLVDLPTGYAQIWAHAPGRFHNESLKLYAVPETNTTIVVQMAKTGGIKGKVVDKNGKPSSGGTIHANPPGDPIGKWGGSMNVEADGTFEFKDVPPGPYTVSTTPSYPGSKPDPNAQEITVKPRETVEVTVKK
jgi:5-hydroxyisourate hydrolase-like protein (transthyretin family)